MCDGHDMRAPAWVDRCQDAPRRESASPPPPPQGRPAALPRASPHPSPGGSHPRGWLRARRDERAASAAAPQPRAALDPQRGAHSLGSPPPSQGPGLGLRRDRRFVDKTAENCLRIPYLGELFPDATFVFLRRGAAGNINSLIEAWKAQPRFVKYRLPEPLEGLGEMSGNRWSFALIPGWRQLRSAPLEEICARQYIACNEAVLDAREGVDRSRWLEVAYEDLVASPLETAERLCRGLGLAFDPGIEEYAAALDRRPSSTTLSAPRSDKWKQQNREAIERILPLTAPIERRLGYEPS